MDWSIVSQLLATLLASGAAAYLLWKLREKLERQKRDREENARSQSSSVPGRPETLTSDATPEQNVALAEKIDAMPDGMLREALSKSVGRKLEGSGDIAAALEELPESMLESLRLALAEEQLVKLDFKEEHVLRPSLVPRRRSRVARTDDPIAAMQYDPTNVLLEPYELAYRAADGQLWRKEWLEKFSKIKAAEVLIDVSGSMEEKMRNGFPRYVVAMAIAIRLLIEAQKGGASYYFRTFDSGVNRLMKATTREEAMKILVKTLQTEFTGGGTEIIHALQHAADDMQKDLGKQISSRNIVLITDAQDELTVEGIKKALGPCELHSVILGGSSGMLKETSTTYLNME